MIHPSKFANEVITTLNSIIQQDLDHMTNGHCEDWDSYIRTSTRIKAFNETRQIVEQIQQKIETGDIK